MIRENYFSLLTFSMQDLPLGLDSAQLYQFVQLIVYKGLEKGLHAARTSRSKSLRSASTQAR